MTRINFSGSVIHGLKQAHVCLTEIFHNSIKFFNDVLIKKNNFYHSSSIGK